MSTIFKTVDVPEVVENPPPAVRYYWALSRRPEALDPVEARPRTYALA